MSTDLIPIVLIAAVIIAAYYLIIFLAFKKRATATISHSKGKQWRPVHQNTFAAFPQQLIDRPVDEPDDETFFATTKEKGNEASGLEMVDDEESILLKAAEIVVEKIQDTVDRIASSPPNPEEVYSKIKSTVNQYQIFLHTEYFDAINSFIAITVERDCGIQFTKEQLLDLWK